MTRSVIARPILACIGLALPLCSAPVLAQDVCGPVIQSLAEIVLTGRDGLPPIQARRFGARAIYLLSQYGGLEEAEVERLLADAAEARMHGAADLSLAWQVHQGKADLSPGAVAEMVDTGNPSAVRALLMTGQADLVMEAIAGRPQNERVPLGQLVVTVSFDQPDTVKADLAMVAEAHDLGWLAAGLAAAQVDPTAWDAAVEGLDQDEIDNLVTHWGWIPGFNGNPVLMRSTAPQDVQALAWREASGQVARASAVQPEFTLINTFLNQTGAFTEAAAVAKSVIKRFNSGELPEAGPLDAGWLASLEAFDREGFDADALRDQFGSLSFGIRRVGRADVGDVLDWIVVVDAVTPYLLGEGPLPGTPPEHLSTQFAAWDHWKALTQAVHDDPEGASTNPPPDDLPVLAELLLAAGEWGLVAQMLDAAPPSPESVGLADDFAGRIDRLCDARLWHKGEAPMLAGQALYKFDATGE